ncbi:hypothetical protein [Paraburkholderia acidicola]|uniref:hypothetical protein n=1 Tax=Paraburkholderia acidicola TaxID=1912599 RepID=UPI0012FFB94F|nr:hypothetical protein [Paraburkholderia acidicola]
MMTSIVSVERSAYMLEAGTGGLLHVRQCVHAQVEVYRPLAHECAVVIREE